MRSTSLETDIDGTAKGKEEVFSQRQTVQACFRCPRSMTPSSRVKDFLAVYLVDFREETNSRSLSISKAMGMALVLI